MRATKPALFGYEKFISSIATEVMIRFHRVTAARALNVSAVKQVMRRNRLKPTAM